MRKTLYRNLGDRVGTISMGDLLKEIKTLAIQGEDETSSKVGADSDQSKLTWGTQLMLERELLLQKIETLAVQGEDENPSQVGVDTDRFVVIREKEQRHQLLLNR